MPLVVRLSRVFTAAAVLSSLFLFPALMTAGTHSKQVDRGGGSGWIGIAIQDITEGIKEASGLKTEDGVLVNEVTEGSPAEKGGLSAGDVLLKYDGARIEDSSQFVELVRETAPGSEAKISLLRDGKEMEITVEVGERPDWITRYEIPGEGEPWISRHQEGFPFVLDIPKISGGHIGVLVEDMNPQLAVALGVKEVDGAFVIEANEDGPAYKAGIRGGDIILKVGDKEVDDTASLRSAIHERKKGEEVELTVLRKKERKTFSVTVEESPGFPSFDKDIKIFRHDDEHSGLEDMRHEVHGAVDREMAKLKEELEALKEELKELKDTVKEKITN